MISPRRRDSSAGRHADETVYLRFELGDDLAQKAGSMLEPGQFKTSRAGHLPGWIEDLDFNIDQIGSNVEKGEAGEESQPVSQMRIEQLRLGRSLHLYRRKKGPLYVTKGHIADNIGDVTVYPDPADEISIRQIDQLADVALDHSAGREHDRRRRSQGSPLRDTGGKDRNVERGRQIGRIDEGHVAGNIAGVGHLSTKNGKGPFVASHQAERISSPSEVLTAELLVSGHKTVGNRHSDVALIEG